MSGTRQIVFRISGRSGRGHTAFSDSQIYRRINFGIIKFGQNVVAANADLRGAESDKRRYVKAAHANQLYIVQIRFKTQQTGIFVKKASSGFMPTALKKGMVSSKIRPLGKAIINFGISFIPRANVQCAPRRKTAFLPDVRILCPNDKRG